MGIYFENTNDEEDAAFILQGVKDKQITTDYLWARNEERLTNKDAVWTPDPEGGVLLPINNINVPGKLTQYGVTYIMTCLHKCGRTSSTLE